MLDKLPLRSVLDLVLLICILQGWWIAAFVAAIVHVYLLSYPFEVIIAGIMYDSLFGLLPGTGVGGYAGTIAMISVTIIVSLVKKLLRH